MVSFERFTLPNGLKVIVHPDKTTPMVVLNIIYNVGSKDEQEEKTGFAHLFEHLMFGGSVNIDKYDEPLQMAGGENNAFTTNDMTCYFIQLPRQNIETAFWLESDRMLSLAFNEESLEVQRKVVCEEFKEHYINKPYGDVWAKIRALSYKIHPYRWMTIGKELAHIEEATLQDVKDFFKKYYSPNNAVMVVAGNVELDEIKALSEKWFSGIAPGETFEKKIPQEAAQQEARYEEVHAEVPYDAIYISWHMGARLSPRYYAADLIAEILGGGQSSRLYQKLLKGKQYFSNIDCHHGENTDAGLLTIGGKLVKGVTMQQAEAGIHEVIQEFLQEGITEKELQKVKNVMESSKAFEDMELMNRSINLAYFESLGDAALMSEEAAKYNALSAADIMAEAQQLFVAENSNTLRYFAQPNKN